MIFMVKRNFFLLVPFILIVVFLISQSSILEKINMKLNKPKLVPIDTRQPTESNINGKVKVKYPQDYTLVLLGDSITEKLGNCDELLAYLKKYYPSRTFQILNYGYGATNILSVSERLEKETFHGRIFRPVLDIVFDLILIESFGHNPLSEFPLEEGLKKQTESLEKIVKSIKEANPSAKIVFVATLAPNKKKYGEGQVDLTTEKRAQWASERMKYIENHIKYAKDHNIPLVNIYEDSKSGTDGGNLDYFDKKDYIHPSPNGVYFISKEIAKYIFEKRIFPR